jgi:hypothetical protein
MNEEFTLFKTWLFLLGPRDSADPGSIVSGMLLTFFDIL